jgi:hypothetical protein
MGQHRERGLVTGKAGHRGRPGYAAASSVKDAPARRPAARSAPPDRPARGARRYDPASWQARERSRPSPPGRRGQAGLNRGQSSESSTEEGAHGPPPNPTGEGFHGTWNLSSSDIQIFKKRNFGSLHFTEPMSHEDVAAVGLGGGVGESTEGTVRLTGSRQWIACFR